MLKIKKLYWLAIPMVLVIGIIGCNLFDRDQVSPTGPGDLANFGVYASSGGYSVATGTGYLAVNVPGGTHAIFYRTNSGPYYIVLTVSSPSLIMIGLNTGDTLIDASVASVSLVSPAPAKITEGSATVYARPDSALSVDQPHPVNVIKALADSAGIQRGTLISTLAKAKGDIKLGGVSIGMTVTNLVLGGVVKGTAYTGTIPVYTGCTGSAGFVMKEFEPVTLKLHEAIAD
jgi:hypothetical protein